MKSTKNKNSTTPLEKSETKTEKKKKRKGNKERWPSLNVKRQVSNRREYIDYDYLDKLSPEEKDWLNQFTKEYHIASFNKDESKRLIKDTREIYRNNNSRNKCMLSMAKSTGLLDNMPTKVRLDEAVDKTLGPYNGDNEESLVAKIDFNKDLEKAPKRPYKPKKGT